MYKTVYLIPGYGETSSDPGYTEIVNIAKNKGYNVVVYNPIWKRYTIKKWLSDFNKLISENQKQEPIVVIGFSFGAYIASLAAKDNKFQKIIFCSLSPYFKDDIENLPKLAYDMLGKRRIDDFSINEFPTNVNTEAVFIVGDKDIPLVVDRVKKSYNEWAGTKKIEILKDIPHYINFPVYIEKIVENI